MSTQNRKVRSGNRILVQFDGQTVGLVQSLRANDDYGPEPASGVGDIHAVEYVPTMARHTVNVQTMVLNTGDLRTAGIASENGDAALKGAVFDIVVQSKDDGTVLRKYISCSYASGDIEISKHTIVISGAVFNALDVQGTGI